MLGRGAAGLAPHFTDEQLSVVYQNIFEALGQDNQPRDLLSVYIQTLGALRCRALSLSFLARLGFNNLLIKRAAMMPASLASRRNAYRVMRFLHAINHSR